MWRRANEYAAKRLVEEIMPLVWAENPAVGVDIVGSRPTDVVRSLAGDDRVRVSGAVKSLDAAILEAKVVACPTVHGGGVLMKLLRAMALGAPVVADEWSLKSIGANPTTALAARTNEDFAEGLQEALTSDSLAEKLGANARSFIADNFRWDDVCASFDAAYVRACG
jgi:glycosyltransferase involved in cell wall biosynthesis